MSTHIPLDIELEIMKWLPVKSLIRFISVCKAWNSLIKCPEFVAGYRVLPTQPHHLLVLNDVEETEPVCFVDDDTFPQQKFSPTFPPLVQLLNRSTLIDSSQGLLCFYGFFLEPDNSVTDMVVLWNPLIRKSIAVTGLNVVDQTFNYVIGFGVCPYTNDPKLVKVTFIKDERKIESISCIPDQVMVFTLSSGEWTPSCSNQLPRKSIQFEKISQVVIGRFIYWNAYEINYEDHEFHNLIISYDLSTDEFGEVDLPDSLRKSDLSVSRLKESLVLLEYYISSPTNTQVCDVWKMEHGDRKTFTKLFTIKAPNASIICTLGFRKTGEPIIQMDDDDDDDDNDEDFDSSPELVLYESCLEHMKDLRICITKHPFYISYTESLLLLDQDDGHIVRCGAVKN